MKRSDIFGFSLFLEKDLKRKALLFHQKNVPDSFVDEITEEIQNRDPNLEILPRKGN